jgi:predicted DNA-binding transcriptional regulator YafY
MRLVDIEREFDVTRRTRNKWLKRLQEEFPPFASGTGGVRLERVGKGAEESIRLVHDTSEDPPATEMASLAAAVHVARRLLSVTSGTTLGGALDMLIRETEERVKRSSGLDTLLSDLDRKFFCAPQAEKDYRDQAEVLEQLTRAVLFRRRVAFPYKSPSAKKPRLVELEPYTLLFASGAIYIAGRSMESDRVEKFDVLRIEGEVKHAPGKQTRFLYPAPGEYDPSSLVEGSFGVFTEDGPLEEVRVVFEPVKWLVKHITERQWHPSQTYRRLDDESLELRVRVRSLVGIGAMLFGLSPYIREVEPAPDRFRSRAELAERGDGGEDERV